MRLPGRKPTLADIVLIAVIVLSGALFLIAASGNGGASSATVRTENEEFEVPLGKNAEFPVSSGGYDFVIAVADGEIYVAESNCPDGICKATRPVGKRRGSIVCMPAKLIINCEAGGDDGADVIVP